MASANDLIVMFVGLETLSLAFYVLAASDRRRRRSQESGMKYFVLGGFSSAFFLYGIALLYGGTGSTNIGEIVTHFQNTVDKPARGRPGPRRRGADDRRARVQGGGRSVPRVDARRLRRRPDAGHRVHGVGRQGGRVRGDAAGARDRPAVPPRRLATGGVGARGAVAPYRLGARVVQTNVKRMLAYSSISHAGFVLIGVEAAGIVPANPIPVRECRAWRPTCSCTRCS